MRQLKDDSWGLCFEAENLSRWPQSFFGEWGWDMKTSATVSAQLVSCRSVGNGVFQWLNEIKKMTSSEPELQIRELQSYPF